MSDDLDTASASIDPGAGPEKPSRRLDPGFRRNIIIVGVSFLVVIAVVVFIVVANSGKKQSSSSRSEVSLGAGQAQTADNMTPDMKAKLIQKQTEEARAAAQAGQTYIPPDPTGAALPVTAGPGPSNFAVGTQPVIQHAQGLDPETQRRREEGLRRQLEAIAGGSFDGAVRQRTLVASAETGTKGSAASGATTTGVQSAASLKSREIVPGLTIAAAELASDIKVAAGGAGFASAVVRSGPAAGAFLIGTARVTDESLAITFDKMRLDGVMYAVDVMVLDEATANNAIEGQVDRRILQRYVFPVALAVAQGFFTAKSQTGSTAVSISAGSTNVPGVTTPAPSSEQARAAGVAAGLQIAGQQVQQAANQPIQVYRERRFPVGVLFRAPVLEVKP